MATILADQYDGLILIGDDAELNGNVTGDVEARYGSRICVNGTVVGALRVARGASATVTGTVGSADIASGATLYLSGTVRTDLVNRGRVVMTGTVRGGLTNVGGDVDLTTEGRVLDRR